MVWFRWFSELPGGPIYILRFHPPLCKHLPAWMPPIQTGFFFSKNLMSQKRSRWWFQTFCLFSPRTLGGGFKHFVYFHPEPWGRWTQFDEHIFQMGGSTTNQKRLLPRYDNAKKMDPWLYDLVRAAASSWDEVTFYTSFLLVDFREEHVEQKTSFWSNRICCIFADSTSNALL